MKINSRRYLQGLALANLAVFLAATCFLPKPSSYEWRTGNPFSYYLNSREDWHIAFLILGVSVLLSAASYLILDAFDSVEFESGRSSQKGGKKPRNP